MLFLDCNAFAMHWSSINKFLPIKYEMWILAHYCIQQMQSVLHKMTPDIRLGIKGRDIVLLLLTLVWFLFVAVAGQRHMKLRYEVQLDPKHLQLGKLHPSCKDHPNLSLWSDGSDLVRQHGFIHTIFSTEKHQYEKVVLLWSCLLKNASNSLCMRNVWDQV